MSNTRREEMQCGTTVLRAVALTMRRERLPRAQIRPYQKRVDHACGRAGIRQALVSAWNHLRQRVRGSAEHARERGDFFHVVRRVAAHARRVDAPRGMDQMSRYVFPVRSRYPEMPCDGLQPVSRQVARGEIVAAYRVQRVYEFAPGRHEADAAFMPCTVGNRVLADTAPGGARRETRARDTTEHERHAEHARTPFQERKIEALKIVILDDIGIRIVHSPDESSYEIRFGCVVISLDFQHLGSTMVVSDRDHEDAIAPRI